MALEQAKDFLNSIRTVELGALRDHMMQPPLLLVVGPDAQRAQQFAFALAGAEMPDEQAARATTTVATPEVLDGLQVGPVAYDAVILLDPTPAIRQHPVIQRFVGEQRHTALITILTGPGAAFDPGLPTIAVSDPADPHALRALRARLVPLLHPDRRAAWGRVFPGFRQPVTDSLIEQTARANAQFAVMADLAARIPMVGQFASTGADFLILTKNQLVLAYQLAAIHGRDLSDQKTALMSAAPFLIAGLGWRELAHRAVRLVPGAPLVPKAVIAYGGTVVSGALARALADPDGVRAWLAGVQAGTKTSLGIGGAKLQNVRARIGGALDSAQERFSNRARSLPVWRRSPKPTLELEPPVHVIPATS